MYTRTSSCVKIPVALHPHQHLELSFALYPFGGWGVVLPWQPLIFTQSTVTFIDCCLGFCFPCPWSPASPQRFIKVFFQTKAILILGEIPVTAVKMIHVNESRQNKTKPCPKGFMLKC